MKAVVYKDAYNVAVDEVPDPRIENPKDAIIKITTTNICGSDGYTKVILHPAA